MIEFRNLIKKYNGNVVLQSISVTLNYGQIYCLLGKNGVGKTTLIHCLLNMEEIDEASITIFGNAHTSLSIDERKRIGVLSAQLALIEELNALEYLHFIGKMYHLDMNIVAMRAKGLLAYFFGNEIDLKKNIGSFSSGMQKKIAFCGSVIHLPDVLILDEPFANLDPIAGRQMVEFIQKYANDQRLVLISSHDLSYVEKLATHIGVLSDKAVVFDGLISDFYSNSHQLEHAFMSIIESEIQPISTLDWI
jgi:ABC-2 type transport system ATP-binding protein